MNIENIKNIFKSALNKHLSEKTKTYSTISLAWIIFIGYLTWWNGLKSFALDKTFRWDEWFGLGLYPLQHLIYFTLFGKKKIKLNLWKLKWEM